jgi:peptidoglycan hydrolase CwlO-like protein
MENISRLLDSKLAPINTKLDNLEKNVNDIFTEIKELDTKLGRIFEMSFSMYYL